MKIRLWNRSEFSKKINSTKQPSAGTGTEFEGFLRNSDPVSIYAPTIVLQFRQGAGGSEASTLPVLYTYAYIPDFGRYYFITDVVHDSGQWILSLVVDVLASFKSEIGSERMYVLRSSQEYEGHIVDTKYPTTAEVLYRSQTFGNSLALSDGVNTGTLSNAWNKAFSDGYYTIGVYGGTVSGVSGSGVNWYSMTYTGFAALANALGNYTPSNFDDVSAGVAKALANPAQYIAAVYWSPFPVLGLSYDESVFAFVKFGPYQISIPTAGRFDPVKKTLTASTSVNLTRHPQSGDRGKYLYLSPYTRYTLSFYPFGTIDLDTTKLIVADTLNVVIHYDYSTGKAVLEVTTGTVEHSLLGRLSAMLGVPVNLTQAVIDYIGAASSVVSGAVSGAGAAGSAFAGDPLGAVSGIASAAVGLFTGIEKAQYPIVSTVGGGGDTLTWGNREPPTLYTVFTYVVNEWNEELGRPLCAVRTPAALGGYILANGAKIQIPGTRRETEEIENYLNSGFFYE